MGFKKLKIKRGPNGFKTGPFGLIFFPMKRNPPLDPLGPVGPANREWAHGAQKKPMEAHPWGRSQGQSLGPMGPMDPRWTPSRIAGGPYVGFQVDPIYSVGSQVDPT